ncbi:MAG: metal-dependent hydrolase [Spartobacteria bacterium]|nr:metal-dependent hydrolase [Spartobacteria bacterium]
MKGISHFISGVAAASFFPFAVHEAANGNPLYFVLGGAFGILPDTLDFKFYRFFYKHDIYIEPDPLRPDPQKIADQLAEAVAKAAEQDEMVKVKLSTIRLGADYWQQYVVRFDPDTQEVLVRFGPVVNTGQVPVPNSEQEENNVGRAKLAMPIVQTYDATTRVDIFDGPTFGFEKDEQGEIVLHFLPWHREWSHSFTMGALCAVLGGLIWGWGALFVIMAGYSVHVIEDQLGFMGSNLFFPFTKKRSQGVHIMRSGDALPNFTTVWVSCLLIFWNLYRFTPDLPYSFSFFHVALYGAIIPMGLYAIALHILSRRDDEEEVEIDMADEWGDSKMS